MPEIIVTFRFAAEESDNVEELIYDTSQCVSDLLRKQLGRDPEMSVWDWEVE